MSELIEYLENRRLQAMLGGDIDALDQLLDEECLYVHTNGLRETKAEYIAMVRSGQYRYLSVTSAERSIRIVGDMAIVLGVTTLKVVLPDGAKKTVHNRSVVVWIRRTGPWQVLHYQGTALPLI